jgi:hypothetical protein
MVQERAVSGPQLAQAAKGPTMHHQRQMTNEAALALQPQLERTLRSARYHLQRWWHLQ